MCSSRNCLGQEGSSLKKRAHKPGVMFHSTHSPMRVDCVEINAFVGGQRGKLVSGMARCAMFDSAYVL